MTTKEFGTKHGYDQVRKYKQCNTDTYYIASKKEDDGCMIGLPDFIVQDCRGELRFAEPDETERLLISGFKNRT